MLLGLFFGTHKMVDAFWGYLRNIQDFSTIIVPNLLALLDKNDGKTLTGFIFLFSATLKNKCF